MKIIRNVLLLSLLLALPVMARADGSWVLAQSTLIYQVSHPLHHVEGVSHAARGRGVCHDGTCNFLAAAPVKSFDSGDTNRDLHMLEVVRGAEFPMAIVRADFPEADLKGGVVHVDLSIQFAGQTADLKQVMLRLVNEGSEIRVEGTIPATLTDFHIKPPELLAMPIKNEIPISVDMTWRKM
jgi:hypothetical protein